MGFHIRPRFEAMEDYSPGYVYGSIVSQSILYGLLLVPSAWALLLCMRRGFKRRATLCMAFLTLLMLGTSTAYLASSIVTAVTGYFTSSPQDIFFRSGTAQLFLPAVNYIASDAIVLWRAWALCTTIGSRQAHIILIPSALLLGSFVAIIVSIICEVSQGYPLFITFDPDMATNGLFASWVLSLATNIAATCIIRFKAWNHRKFVSANLTQRDGKLKSERILAVIVESGLLYCIFWFVLLVINLGFFFEPVYEGEVAAWNLGMILQDDSVHISVWLFHSPFILPSNCYDRRYTPLLSSSWYTNT
ncbi:uncharacterized protein STEHIDRAFT_108082 [Stereum hirsutum FP-91666 SS1]|uniref:uncharacterized protein n=1 Tax=Stereum hirsutum (strain FP-91666) TaxID=721885 RepID=UPI000440B004|nr:uncharacterized protein STEHIDRAFT_108082 [Stereum hirsutum FP-91666 SS1]EIM91554.1 hypothetical protein STEHIDRAFT_108082 [Stereum hirsutum FP-91666 SS1]